MGLAPAGYRRNPLPPGRRERHVRILIWHLHGSWLTAFVQEAGAELGLEANTKRRRHNQEMEVEIKR